MKSINPATGKVLKVYAEHSASQAAAIVTAAQRGYQEWRRMDLAQRGTYVAAVGRLLFKNKEDDARLISEEMGKPICQARAEIDKCAWVCQHYSKNASGYLAEEPVRTEAAQSYVRFEPLGVVLAVMPWNFPFWQVFRAAVPALMAGNTMVLKHAANVSGCARAIEGVFRRAGLPKNVFSSLLISSDKVRALIEHPAVQAVTLTGSTQAGRIIAAQAGGMIKKAVLELGGSDPYIVLADAQVSAAATICANARMINSGQSCVAAKRFLVAEKIFDQFLGLFVQRMKQFRAGPPLDDQTTLGPLARKDLRDLLHRQIRNSVRQGATLVMGGYVPQGPGAYYPPTVLTDVRPGMPAYTEELFGPAAVVHRVRDERQAVQLANDTVFGLGASIFTRDWGRGRKLAEMIEAGVCCINDSVKSDPRLPFGGIKDSGYGRELGEFGIREFVNIKTVWASPTAVP